MRSPVHARPLRLYGAEARRSPTGRGRPGPAGPRLRRGRGRAADGALGLPAGLRHHSPRRVPAIPSKPAQGPRSLEERRGPRTERPRLGDLPPRDPPAARRASASAALPLRLDCLPHRGARQDPRPGWGAFGGSDDGESRVQAGLRPPGRCRRAGGPDDPRIQLRLSRGWPVVPHIPGLGGCDRGDTPHRDSDCDRAIHGLDGDGAAAPTPVHPAPQGSGLPVLQPPVPPARPADPRDGRVPRNEHLARHPVRDRHQARIPELLPRGPRRHGLLPHRSSPR